MWKAFLQVREPFDARSDELDAVGQIPPSTLYGDVAYGQLGYLPAPRHHHGWLAADGSAGRGILEGE